MSVVALDIGCLECGRETEMVGVFPDVDAAKTALLAKVEAERAQNPDRRPQEERLWRWESIPVEHEWHGQTALAVFDLDSHELVALAMK